MNKETFDKTTAQLWQLYSAGQTLHGAGVSARVTNEALQALLHKTCAALGEDLATSLEAKPQAA